MPVVREVPLATPALIKDLSAAALVETYSEPEDALAIEMGLPPSEFYGRPLIEVMLIRRARYAAKTGDDDVIERILDRELGKPKTTAENHNINESYEDALARIGKAEKAQPVEAMIVQPWEDLL